jgi:hypothetical protein
MNNQIVIKNNTQQQGHMQRHKKPLPAKHVVALRNHTNSFFCKVYIWFLNFDVNFDMVLVVDIN